VSILLTSFAGAVELTKRNWDESEWEVEGNHAYLVRIVEDPVNKPKTRMCKAEILSADSLIYDKAVHKKVVIYLPKDSLSLQLIGGDCLWVEASLKKPELPYLRKQSYAAVAFIRSGDWSLQSTPAPLSQQIYFQSLTVRRSLFNQLRIILPDQESFSVAVALMFGYKDELDKDLRQRFSNIGAGHILAVSGLHFNLLFGVIYSCLSFLGMSMKGKICKQFIQIPLIWGFAFITGFSPSVIRAACMLTFWGIGNAFFYKSFTLNTVAVVAFFMLLLRPLYLFDVGFQLSFAAVVAIVIINPIFVELYASKNKIIQYLWELVSVSFSAQVGVLPLSLYYFHQFPLLFLVTNLLIIPLSGILLILIPLSLILHAIFSHWEVLTFPLRWLVSLFIFIARSLDEVPGGTISGVQISVFGTFLLYISFAFIIYLLIRKN
jgi:competence protein ComEC